MINKNDLPKEVVEKMEELLSKEQSTLTFDEVSFLKSRSAYLTKKELAELPEVSEPEVTLPPTGTGEAPNVDEPKKKAKRKFLK